MEPITFKKSSLTLADYTSINWKYMRKTRKTLFIFPVITVITLVSLLSVFISKDNSNINKDGLWMPLAMALLCISTFTSIRKGIKKNYHNTPDLSTGIIYTLREDSISMQGNSLSSTLPWPVSFKKAFEIDKWILLSSSGNTAYYLDTESILAPATISDVKILFQQKGIKLT